MENVIQKLINDKKTISTMESCTGGALANTITNISGASEVFKFGAVTYSNEYKIKMGVDSKVIDEYTVYSKETAGEMSKAISIYTNSDYGVGITGKLNRPDSANPYNSDNIVYISVYDKNEDIFVNQSVTVSNSSREINKNLIIRVIINMLNEII